MPELASEAGLVEPEQPSAYKVATEHLQKHFPMKSGVISRIFRGESDKAVRAVDDVTFGIKEGEAFGLAGESGCGKTTLGKTIIRLLDPTAGSIYFDGEEVTDIEGKQLKAYRREAQIIHQDPYQSINPRFRVYRWVREPLDVHKIGTEEERDARVYEVLEMAGLEPASEYAQEYPTELSGGERQRVGIARALALGPSFLMADEPASMLDVSIRASVLEVFKNLQHELGMTSLYISHDLSLLKHICDRIGIMYLGQLVEVGPAAQIINDPQHPYTQALVSSVPRIDPTADRNQIQLVGEVPDPVDVPQGCRFHPRCPKVVPPREFSFEQAEWRAVASLKYDLLKNELQVAEDVEEPTPDDVREFYEVPNPLTDERAEKLLAQAISDVIEEDDTATDSLERLESAFQTICADPGPNMVDIGVDRRAMCVLHDETLQGELS